MVHPYCRTLTTNPIPWEALALLRELQGLEAPSLEPNVVTYTAAMAACGRGRQWRLGPLAVGGHAWCLIYW